MFTFYLIFISYDSNDSSKSRTQLCQIRLHAEVYVTSNGGLLFAFLSTMSIRNLLILMEPFRFHFCFFCAFTFDTDWWQILKWAKKKSHATKQFVREYNMKYAHEWFNRIEHFWRCILSNVQLKFAYQLKLKVRCWCCCFLWLINISHYDLWHAVSSSLISGIAGKGTTRKNSFE